jgi:DNA-directed RNA polymerase specialized sigma24 family protein
VANPLDPTFAEYGTDPDRYQTKFLALCTRKAEERLRRSCPNDAEDLAQQVVIEVWRTLDKFNPAKGSFTTWFNLIVRSVRDTHLGGKYREAEVIDVYSEVNNAGDVCNGDDSTDEDSAAVRTKSSSHAVNEPNLSGIDLQKLTQLKDVDSRLVGLLSAGASLAECQRTLNTTRAKIRTQVAHLKNELSHLHIAQK